MRTIGLCAGRCISLAGILRLILYTAFCFCIGHSIYAQDRPSSPGKDSLHFLSLKEVMIISGGHSLIDTSASPVQLLKGKELERINSLSVADAVRYFSGVQLKDYGGIGGLKTINVRSLGTNHTAVFYDGVQLGNAQNGQVDLGKFSLDNIEEIALYDGQKSSIFQPASGFASASSLYLTARQATFKTGSSSNEKFTVRTGSFGLFNPSILWQYRLSDKVYSTVSTEWTMANGRYRFRETNGVYDTTAVRKNGDINAQRIEAGLVGRGKDSSGWSAKFYLYNSGRGLPVAIVSNNFGADTARQRLWDRNIFLQSSYHKDTRSYSLMANAKYSSGYSHYFDPSYVQDSGLLNNYYREKQLYLSVSQLYRLYSWWNISLSDDYLYNTLDANLFHFPFPTRNNFLNALATEIHFPGFNLQGSLLSTIVSDKVRQYSPAGSRDELTPAVLMSWKPLIGQNLRIRGFYKRIFRMPTFNDLYYTFIGNSFLKPEYTTQYDLGFTWGKYIPNHFLQWVSVQLDAYFNHVTDKIIAVPGANLFRWTMLNLGKVDVKGLAINARSSWQPARDLHLNTAISYTYEQSLNKTDNEHNNQPVPYSPLHSGSLLVGADYRRLSLNYSLIYTGFRYDESAEIRANYLEPWYTHDLAMSYTLPFRTHLLKGTMEVNNLFSQYYDVVTSFPMPGRSYRITLQFTY